MKLKIKEATTSKILHVFIQDSSSSTGAGLAGVLFSDITGYWIAEGDAAPTAITMATMTLGTYASGGFKEIDATNMPGWYQFCPPDVAINDTSEGSVGIMLKGATNMAPCNIEIELDTVDYRSASWAQLMLSAGQIITGTVSTAVLTPSTTDFAADDITETTDDHYKSRIILWTSGALVGQVAEIVSYTIVSSEGNFNVSAMTEAPANNDTFVII